MDTESDTPQASPSPLISAEDLSLHLFLAVCANELATCEHFLRLGADPSAKLEGQQGTPLTAAISRGFEQAALLMLDHGARVEAVSPAMPSPLKLAATKDSSSVCRALLLRGAQVDHAVIEGNTALLLAARQSSLSAAKVLVANGANVNAHDDSNRTVLHKAVQSFGQHDLEFTKLALDAGADPDFVPKTPEPDYLTPFQWTLKCAAPQVTQYMIDRFPDLIDKPTRSGQDPLDIASADNAQLVLSARAARSVEMAVDASDDSEIDTRPSRGFAPL